MESQSAVRDEYAAGSTVDDKLTTLFQPDTLIPAQYLETFRRRSFLAPEKKLMLAVLEDAVNCFKNNIWAKRGKAKRLFDDTEEWILEEAGDWLFSFANVCEVLGLDPSYTRQGLLRWKEEKLAKIPKGWLGTPLPVTLRPDRMTRYNRTSS